MLSMGNRREQKHGDEYGAGCANGLNQFHGFPDLLGLPVANTRGTVEPDLKG